MSLIQKKCWINLMNENKHNRIYKYHYCLLFMKINFDKEADELRHYER